MPTQIFPAQFEMLDAIREMAGDVARSAGFDEKDIYNVQLAVDEAASNIIEHAYEGIPDGRLELTAEVRNGNLVLSLRDWGTPFESMDVVEPDITANLEDRAIGGLGLFFMRKLMDEVHFLPRSEDGNLVTMIKCCPTPPTPEPQSRPGWRDLLSMSERILVAATFAEQRDILLETAHRLLPRGEITLWLDEQVFRLPDWLENLFPPEPPLPIIAQAIQVEGVLKQSAARLAIAMRHEDATLGGIAYRLEAGKRLRRQEVELIEGLARAASVALIAWHRITVERWRINQLNLVRTVSSQIANESNLDELALKVVRLIQNSFRYYYVALFTLEPGQNRLRFLASAGGATRRKGRALAPVVQVSLGKGMIGFAAQAGEELITNDVTKEAHFVHLDSLPETHSEAVFPLKVEERVLGVLDVQSDKLNAFHPYDLLVLRALADSIAMAVDGVYLYGALNRRAEHLRAVAEVSRQITSFLDLRELMQEVAQTIQKRFGYPYVHLFTVHPNRRQIHYEAGSGARSAALEGYTLSLDDEDGMVPMVARTGERLLANDVSTNPHYRPSPLPPANTRAELTLPLAFGGQVYGVLDVQSDQLHAFGDDDVVLLEALADAIAAAVRNADLYRSEQWRRQVGDSLREVAVLLSANASLEQVLEAILTELERNLPSDITAIWLLDDEDIYCAAVHGAKAPDLEDTRLLDPEAATALTRALLADQPLVRKPGEAMGPSGMVGGFGDDYSSIAAPLRIGGQAVGVLTLAHHTPGRYGHESLAMTTTFASYAAVAIENARLYDSAQEQAYASAALLQVAQAVVSLSDLEEILGTIIRILPILVGVERAALYCWDAGQDLFIPSQGYNLPDDATQSFWQPLHPEEFPMLLAALELGQYAICDEAHLGPENWLMLEPSPDLEGEGLMYTDDRLLMAFPLLVKGEFFGVLLAEEALGGRRFRARRIEILTGVAQQAALAIQNDLFQRETVARERLETEVQLARQIQQAFIPDKLPEHPHWELAARWRTARQVGGDFYDVFELPNGRVGLFIADVADKGVPAALFMALTRTLVRAAVLEIGSPAEALRRVNDLLYPDCHQGMFVTAVYGVIDEHNATFTYANAGHNPPLFITRGKVELLTRTGIALGVLESADMEERVVHLKKGDCLYLYTDGVTEAFSSAGQIFGDERLLATLSETKFPSAAAVLEIVDQAVIEFIGDEPASDDMTMLSVRRC